MTDLKITGLTELAASPATDDVLPVVDISDTMMAPSGTTKKISFANLLSNYIAKTLYDAQTILIAVTDNTPVALTVAEQTIVGRATGGNITALAIDSDLSSVSANDDTVPSAKATKAALDGKADTSHAHSLDSLSDVAISSAAQGDIIIRDATQFVNNNIGTNEVIARLPAGDVDGISMAASTILARLASGNIVAATVAQIKTLLAYALSELSGILALAAGGLGFDASGIAKGGLIVGTGAGTAGLKTVGTDGHVLTADSTVAGGVKWAAGAGGGATTALDNLASVAINTSLISDTDNTDDLGSSSIKWRNMFSNLLTLEERSAPSTPLSGDMEIYAQSTDSQPRVLNDFGQDASLVHGYFPQSQSGTVSTTYVELINVTIKADQMGTRGRTITTVRTHINNNSGAARTYTLKYTFGGYTIEIPTSATVAVGAGSRSIYELVIESWCDGSQSTQYHQITYKRTVSTNGAVFQSWAENIATWDQSTGNNTNADFTLKVELKSSADTTTQTFKAVSSIIGPYHG